MTRPFKRTDELTDQLTTLHESEEGFVSVVNVVSILLCTILMGLVVNAGNIVRHKIETQNAADATAYTDALWHARGMNTVTMTNHVIGEITAFVVMHEAIGGDKLDDENQEEQTKVEDAALDAAYNVAQGASPVIQPIQKIKDMVRQEDGIYAERTLLDSKKQLKTILAVAYGVKAVSGGLEKTPYTYAIGLALDGASTLTEVKVGQEYLVLIGLHKVATILKPVSKALQKVVLPAMKIYTTAVYVGTPAIGQLAAMEIAEQNDTSGLVFHSWLTLPLEEDPVGKDLNSNSPENTVKKTQLVRATYPWVTFHRKPILDFMLYALTFSGAQGHYKKHSNECTIEVCRRLQADGNMELYVMERKQASDKGFEEWTNDSKKADNLFTMVGFVHAESPPAISPAVYAQAQEEGMVAYAQAMFYNANPQEPSSFGSQQAAVGWDTLNWEGRPVEYKTSERSTGFPKIKVNWQAKLVPVTNNRMLLAQPLSLAHGRIGKVMQKTVGLKPLNRH